MNIFALCSIQYRLKRISKSLHSVYLLHSVPMFWGIGVVYHPLYEVVVATLFKKGFLFKYVTVACIVSPF